MALWIRQEFTGWQQYGLKRLDLAVLGASGIRIHCWADAALRQAFHARNYLGLSENSVPLHPMVNDHYPY